ncbi:zinc finger protein 692-like [Scyliorhinus canicula]|uniref:zinc finger protein 692-like n=1 Tax=Scyliorhinus canicula TaxID=7830 RepID=UPI0018F72A63|nr:zinc finger protein 692-like [Scyliorhinus canicula]
MEDRKPSRHRASEDVRRQKRKELDARRSKSRIRLGTHLEQWCNVKDQLGFHLHSDFAKFLLDSYASKSPESDSGPGDTDGDFSVLRTSSDALRQLVIWSHDHSQECGFIPDLKSVVLERSGGSGSLTAVWECIAGHSFPWLLLASTPAIPDHSAATRSRSRTRNCARDPAGHGDPPEGGHYLRMPGGLPLERAMKVEGNPRTLASESSSVSEPGSESDSSQKRTPTGHEGPPQGSKDETGSNCAALGPSGRSTPQHPSPARSQNSASPTVGTRRTRNKVQECGLTGNCPQPPTKEAAKPGDTGPNSKHSARRKCTETRPVSSSDTMQLVCESDSATDEELRRGSRKAGASPVCEYPAVDTAVRNDGKLEVWDERAYLQNVYAFFKSLGSPSAPPPHLRPCSMFLFFCSTDKRDYICEFCARAFRTTSNLIIHRRIHTGEKPLQCEICGFTCRQKASLNWHMKKHDAESGYKFSCDICGKKFEKKDNVNAHKSKSHPETPVSTAAAPPECPTAPPQDAKGLELKQEPDVDFPSV